MIVQSLEVLFIFEAKKNLLKLTPISFYILNILELENCKKNLKIHNHASPSRTYKFLLK